MKNLTQFQFLPRDYNCDTESTVFTTALARGSEEERKKLGNYIYLNMNFKVNIKMQPSHKMAKI